MTYHCSSSSVNDQHTLSILCQGQQSAAIINPPQRYLDNTLLTKSVRSHSMRLRQTRSNPKLPLATKPRLNSQLLKKPCRIIAPRRRNAEVELNHSLVPLLSVQHRRSKVLPQLLVQTPEIVGKVPPDLGLFGGCLRVVSEIDLEPLDGAAALIVTVVGIAAESPACGLCGAVEVVGGIFEAGWGLVLDSFAAPVLEDLDAGVAAFGFVKVGDAGAWKVSLVVIKGKRREGNEQLMPMSMPTRRSASSLIFAVACQLQAVFLDGQNQQVSEAMTGEGFGSASMKSASLLYRFEGGSSSRWCEDQAACPAPHEPSVIHGHGNRSKRTFLAEMWRFLMVGNKTTGAWQHGAAAYQPQPDPKGAWGFSAPVRRVQGWSWEFRSPSSSPSSSSLVSFLRSWVRLSQVKRRDLIHLAILVASNPLPLTFMQPCQISNSLRPTKSRRLYHRQQKLRLPTKLTGTKYLMEHPHRAWCPLRRPVCLQRLPFSQLSAADTE